jgi:hypothetical protein
MYAMNKQNDVIGLVLRENCKSKQVTDFIAWPVVENNTHTTQQTKKMNDEDPPMNQSLIYVFTKDNDVSYYKTRIVFLVVK